MIRVTWSDSVQLRSRPVMNSLFGTTSSLRSQPRMVVARIWIRVTTPSVSPTVTMSPTRTGRSKSMIRPLMKLATISCNPKPMPTPRAATSHWNWDQRTPRVLRTSPTPTATIAYRHRVVAV
jgi:hypothetical protein